MGEEQVKTHRVCTLCIERKRRSRLARTNPRSRESANREPNRSPIPKSAGSQAGSVVSEPPNCSDAFSRGIFSSYDAYSRTRAIRLWYTYAPKGQSARKKIRSIEDRIGLKILDVARTAGVVTAAVNVEVPIYRYVDRTNSSREPTTCLPLFTETKGSARSSLRTIDLLRREYCGEQSMGLLTKRVVYC